MHFCPADQNAPGVGGLGGAGEVGVGHHDQRVVAAELELRALAQAPGLLADALADRDRAGEGDRVHAGVLDERGADFAAAPDDDVEHAARDARVVERAGDVQAGER